MVLTVFAAHGFGWGEDGLNLTLATYPYVRLTFCSQLIPRFSQEIRAHVLETERVAR